VHHNVVWNVPGMPLQVNNPSYFMLCYNNTLWKSGRISTFDHSHRDDMFGCRFQNNISAKELQLPAHVVTEPNLIDPSPGFANPNGRQFDLTAGSPGRGAGVPLAGIAEDAPNRLPDLGACALPWKAGHDFENPPKVTSDVPETAYSNAIRNAAFELGTIEYWTASGNGKASTSKGNGWGNAFGQGDVQKTGTSKHELKLTGPVRVEQVIENLHPNASYQLSGWMRVSDERSPVILGVRLPGGKEFTVRCNDKSWQRKTVDFMTGNDVTKATIFITRSSETGSAFADNLGLPRVAKE
jgi:hypothetical protein